MTLEGVDSFGQPSGASLVAAGKHFNVRYVTGAGKALTTAQVRDLFDNGISVVANFESTKTRALDGWGAGVEDASDARTAMELLGFPRSCPCYFSVDFDAQLVHQGRIDQYLKGAASVLGAPRVGVYGSYAVITRCHGNKTAAWLWQTLSWSTGHTSPFANIIQWLNDQKIGGRLVDFDRAMTVEYGAWDPPPSGGTEEPIAPVYPFSLTPGSNGSLVVSGDGHSYLNLADSTLHPIKAGVGIALAQPAKLGKPIPGGTPGQDRSTGYMFTGTDDPAFLLATDVTFSPTLDCAADIANAITADRASARIVYG